MCLRKRKEHKLLLHCKVIFHHFSKKEQVDVLMDVCNCVIYVTKDEKEF